MQKNRDFPWYMPRQKTQRQLDNPGGRPTKKTKQAVETLMRAISSGAPYSICCAAVGINPDTFAHWKRTDPVFAMQVEQVAAQTALKLWHKIEEHGEKEFQAISWLLERRFPETFSRPEVQLNLIQQTNVNTQGANGHNLESIIVSDLEFLKLREHENYEHRAHERQAREVPGEITVEPALSGHLNREDYPQGTIISESQAGANAKRVSKADEKIEELLKAKRTGNGNGAPADPTSSAMFLPPIKMPAEPVPSHWWAQLTTGSGDREVERATAVKIVRTILSDVFGQLRSQNTPVEFAPGAAILLRDVHAQLESLCGPHGWAALVKRGET